MKMKLMKLLRRKYLLWKYKHNWNSGKLIVLKEGDRQYGLTYMMIKDCLQNGYVLFVNNEFSKRCLAQKIHEYGQLGIVPLVSECDAYDNYLLSTRDIYCDRHKGRKNLKLLIDNSCWYDDVKCLHGTGIEIINGFMYIPIAS